MKKSLLVISVLAILPLIAFLVAGVDAQGELTPEPTPEVIDGRCQSNYFSITRSTVKSEYYLYQQSGLAFSLNGAGGDLTLNSRYFDFNLYTGRVNFTTGEYVINTQVYVEAGSDYTFTVDLISSPQMIIIFDCDVSSYISVTTLPTGVMDFGNECRGSVRPRLGNVVLPAFHTVGGQGYLIPIINKAGTLTLISSLPFSATIGPWFEDYSSGQVQGIAVGQGEFVGAIVPPSTNYTVQTTILPGEGALVTVSCP